MKKLIVIAIALCVLTGSVFAQSLPSGFVVTDMTMTTPAVTAGGFTSPQSTATQGRIRSAADDFMRPDAYTNVRFENWFGMVSYARNNMAALGFATKVGDLYIGTFYNGSFWANVDPFDYTESTKDWLATENKSGVITYDTFGFTQPRPFNQFAVLVGVADMGFRFTLSTTLQTFSAEDAFINGAETKSVDMAQGVISPQIAWSMTKNLMDNGIRPYFIVDLGFNKDYRKGQAYSFDASDGDGVWKTMDEKVEHSNNFFEPKFSLGLGGFTVANKNNWRTSVDLDYVLTLRSYSNEFNYTSADTFTNNSIGEIAGTFGSSGLQKISYNSHLITPSVSGSWNGDKLRLRAKLNLNLGFENTDTTDMYVIYSETTGLSDGVLGKDGDDKLVSKFTFNPDLRLAAQWQLASKLFLNAGGRIQARAVEVTTTTNEVYDENVLVPNSASESVKTTYGAAQVQLTLGATLNATDNLSFEASSGVTSANGLNTFSTGSDGLFHFTSLLATLRF